MRSMVGVVFAMALAACGTVRHSTRVGPMYAAVDGSRAFVTVQRWSTVRELVEDADGEPIERTSLVDSAVWEIGLADGRVTRRAREDGWLSVFAWSPVTDIVWLARDVADDSQRPPVFGLDRAGREAAAPIAALDLLSPHVVASPSLSSGHPVSLWDPIDGRVAQLDGGWPFDVAHELDGAESTLWACHVDARSIFLARADLARAFADGATMPSMHELVVAPPAGDGFACAYTADGERAVAIFLQRVEVFDVRTGARLRTISVPRPIYEVGAVFAGDRTLVIPSVDRSLTLVDIERGVVRTVEPGCCRAARRHRTTGAVVGIGDDRGVLVAADGTTSVLPDAAAVRFARATGLAPWRLPDPVARVIAVPTTDAVLAAGVTDDRVIVQLADRTHVRLRVTLDTGTH